MPAKPFLPKRGFCPFLSYKPLAMRKYISALTALMIAAVLSAATEQSQKKQTLGTYFYFVGSSYSHYYFTTGWKVYNEFTDDLCFGINYPQLIWHSSINSPVGVASALWAANQGTIEADLAWCNFQVDARCDQIFPASP
jgi:hypothetical protein